MIVYLESNFVLELAFLQAEHEHCSALLRLSESGEIRLTREPDRIERQHQKPGFFLGDGEHVRGLVLILPDSTKSYQIRTSATHTGKIHRSDTAHP